MLTGLPEGVLLRPITTDDTDFLYQLYASTRADEMALVNWPEQQKTDFLSMQFNAQHKYYQEQFIDVNIFHSFDFIS